MNKSYFLSGLLFALLALPLVSYAHCKGKHTGDHPHCQDEPPPPPESCADAQGEFPAFAFAKSVRDGRRGTWSGNDIYLADSTGTCELKIFSLDFRSATDPSFRLNGNQGRIIWMQYTDENKGRKEPGGPVLKLLEFTVNAGEVSNITHTLAWKWASDVGPTDNSAAELSPDGNTAYFTLGDHSQLSSGGDVEATVRSVDLTSCNTDCPDTIIASTLSIYPYWDLAMNLSGSRLYFVQLQGGVGFIDTATTDIRYIMKREDFPVNVAFQDISTGYLSSGNEAIAVGYDKDRSGTLDIVDVDFCALDGTPIAGPTCLASGYSTFGKTEIPGGKSTFFSEDWLLVANEGNIDIVDKEGTAESVVYVYDGHAPDSAE
jgi:hypothetical protein